MTLTRISGLFTTTRLVVLTMLVTFMLLAMQPAQAQSSDTWKSVVIIGGSTAAGAYIGHKIGGPTGTWIGAGIGATAGYAIDRRRRANQYRSQSGYYDPNTGYYDPNGGYYGSGGYYGNGGYYGGPYDGASYPGVSQYQSNNYGSTYRQNYLPRRPR